MIAAEGEVVKQFCQATRSFVMVTFTRLPTEASNLNDPFQRP